MDDGVSVQDRNLRVIYANAAHKRNFGEDIEGRYCYQVYERRPRVCPDCPVEMSYRTGKAVRATHRGFDKHGKAIAAEIVATPVFDKNGDIVAGVEVVRMVTEQIEAQELLRRKSERLEKLSKASREISSGLDLDSVLERVVENAAALTGADAGTVALLDDMRGEIRYPYHFNMPAKISEIVVPRGAGIAGETIRTGQPVILDDYEAHPAQVPAFTEAGVKTILAVPFMVGDKPFGALGLFGKSSENKFGKEDVEVAQAIASQAAIAIQNAFLYQETEERLRVQRELIRVAISVTSGLDLSRVLPEVARHAAEIVRADASMVALLDEDTGRVVFPYAYNLPEELTTTSALVGVGVAGKVIESGNAFITNDYATSELGDPSFIKAGVTAVATVPLMIANRCMGAIGVMNKGDGRLFTDDDISVLSIVSRGAAVATENARLYEELSHSAQMLELRVKERTEALSRMYQDSERKTRELEAANLKLRELDMMKSEFLANMSHELRTPLNSIIGFSKLVLDGLDGEINQEQGNDLTIVHSNGLELLRLIDDLLSLAKLEAGRISLNLEETLPDLLVMEASANMLPAATQKRLKIETFFPPDLEPVRLDPGKVRQVLQNLIGNAIKFSEAGRIEVAIEQTPDETVFSVKDVGIGIKAEEIEAIFDRFHQAEQQVVSATAGVGLGLTISKRFVEMHGGRIWVESKPGQGSTFSFTVPRTVSG
ncbi:MAG: GAF domain-containing protein [Actinobacteria bacterium]|nr:GAF domain-containing protein [Actinomycetota bacterium]